MVKEASPSRRIPLPLRGYERMMTIADNASVKVSHVMALRGSLDAVSAFLQHAPQAFALTFNKHPRMRVKQVQGEFAMAEVHPAITTETVLNDKLFEVREVTSSQRQGPENKWEMYVERESNIPIDRYSRFPFYLRVWHYPKENVLRLMLFSDHYMSDGITGLTVLNDVLEFASTLSRDNRVLAPTFPLRPTLYDMWLKPKSWWSLTTSEWIVGLFGKMAFSSEMKNFTPVIPVRPDQSHFQVPIKINSSSALFGQGTRENMLAASKRCNEENITFFGVLAASIVVAFYIAKHGDEEELTSTDPLFKLAAELDYNMRRRVERPAPEAQVGCYFTTAEIERISKEGVDMKNTRFWDLAREVKKAIDEQVDSFMTPFQLILVDQHVNTETVAKFAQDVKIPNSVASDVDISNVGKYPHKFVHAFKTFEGKTSELSITSVHVHSSVPHLGSAASVYVSSVDTLCYSMMHKYENKDAKTLFAAFTTAVDHISQVSTTDTMLDVVKRVRKQIDKQASEEIAGLTGQEAPTAV